MDYMAIVTETRTGLLGRFSGIFSSPFRAREQQPPSSPDLEVNTLLPDAETARSKTNEHSVIFSREMEERLEDNAHHVFKTGGREIPTIDYARSMVRSSPTTERRHGQNIQQEGHETLRELGLAEKWPRPVTSSPSDPQRLSAAPTLISPRRNFGS